MYQLFMSLSVIMMILCCYLHPFGIVLEPGSVPAWPPVIGVNQISVGGFGVTYLMSLLFLYSPLTPQGVAVLSDRRKSISIYERDSTILSRFFDVFDHYP